MAVISDLVRVIAEVEGLEENFVGVYARAAREAGLITQHGRGRNAARMTVNDAANLLIAVNASSLAKYVPDTIVEYSKLVRKFDQEHLLSAHFGDILGKKGVSFAEALSFLVDCHENGKSNAEMILDEARDPKFQRLEPYLRSSIKVKFEGPQPLAKIVIKSLKEEQPNKPPSSRTNADFWYFRDYRQKLDIKTGDRRTSTSISADTLVAVAELLRT